MTSGTHGLPETIPPFSVIPTTTQVFMYSAVTWNRHRIHFDRGAALEEGHQDVVVQRALLGNYLALMLQQWLGTSGTTRQLSWKVISSAIPGKKIHCCGQVVDRTGAMLRCDLKILTDDDTIVVAGTALCELREQQP